MDTQELASFLFSASNFLALPFERNFSNITSVEFAKSNVTIPVVIGGIYLILCFAGYRIMSNLKPFDLRVSLAFWNALLCIFSFIGMCRTVPYLLATILSNDYETTVCSSPQNGWGNGVTGFWVMLFVFSKVAILGDTMFIILRKKPLIFFHWYHHFTVLLFCWNAYATLAGSGLYFVAMNYTVLALMYGFYCLQALGMCPRSFPSFLITFAQIAQMTVGTCVCCSVWYFTLSGKSCHTHRSNLVAGALMYGSYIYLIAEFALKKLVGPSRKRNIKGQ